MTPEQIKDARERCEICNEASEELKVCGRCTQEYCSCCENEYEGLCRECVAIQDESK